MHSVGENSLIYLNKKFFKSHSSPERLALLTSVPPAFERWQKNEKEQKRNVKVSPKEGGEVGRMPNKATEVSTTFLEPAILCYVSQIPDNNKRVQDTFPQ